MNKANYGLVLVTAGSPQEAEAIAHSAMQLDSATQVKSFLSDSPLKKGG